jgi:hypothetical protein
MQQMFFYCRSYCLLNMFRAPIRPSTGAREYYTVGCRLWCLVLGFQVVGMVWSWGLCVRFAGSGHTTLGSTRYRQLENQAPKTTGGNQLYNTLELLLMGVLVPETCWASNKICNKKTSVAHISKLKCSFKINSTECNRKMSSWAWKETSYHACNIQSLCPTSYQQTFPLSS